MSLKKTLRTLEASQRRAERDSRKRQRELEKQQKEQVKMEELERANYEVQVFDNTVEVLTSVHKECGDHIDWLEIQRSNPPDKPEQSNYHEKMAQEMLLKYEPGFSDRLLRRGDKKRKELEDNIKSAKEEDTKDYAKAIQGYEIELADWEYLHSLSERILSNEINAYIECLEKVSSFNEISELGSSINFKVEDIRVTEAELKIHPEKIIPAELKSLLKSGKLSVKQMPKTRFYGLYQDYVCSCAIRVAREVFTLLPTEFVIVNVISELLNSSTGHMEELPILSVAIPRDTLDTLNLEMLDPSEAMANFVHNMKFNKTKGFNPVEKIDKSSFL